MKNRNSRNNRPSLYGFHAVREAFLNEERSVDTLFLTDQAAKGFEETLLEARGKGLRRQEPTIIDKKRLEKMLPRGAVHQGVALACSPLEERDLNDFIIRSATRKRTILVMLDKVTDPHNVGAIMRSACAFGMDGMILQSKFAPELDGVVAKTACGAVEHVPVAHVTNLARSIESLQEEGFYVLGLDERGPYAINELNAQSFPKASKDANLLAPPDPSENVQKIVLVLGSEGDGIRRLIQEKCDELVRLPVPGPIKSLNVSNAAAVAFYALSIL